MCIIVFKPKNHKMPSVEVIARCFETNPHGAGFMYRTTDKKIHIRKGFMTIGALVDALNETNEKTDLQKTDVCLHFRISTTGSIVPPNCHPFPLSYSIADLKSLDIIADRAIAHNGILHEYSKFHEPTTDMSDTMYFAKMLSGVKERFLAPVIQAHASGSRFVLMTETKSISFGMIRDKGLFFSNGTYQQPTRATYTIPHNWKDAREENDNQQTIDDMFREYMNRQRAIEKED